MSLLLLFHPGIEAAPEGEADLTSTGLGAMAAVGAAMADVALGMSGTSTFTATTESAAAVPIASAGTGVATFAGAALAPAALYSEGVGAFTAVTEVAVVAAAVDDDMEIRIRRQPWLEAARIAREEAEQEELETVEMLQVLMPLIHEQTRSGRRV